MNDWDQRPPGAGASTHDAERQTAGTYRVDVGGDARGPVVAGNHNVVVDAQHGSQVTVLMAGQRPRPVRRPTVELLPRRQPVPIGRESELALLAQAVDAGGPVQLWGDSGVGKTTLLRHAARQLRPGPDGVVFVSARGHEPGDIAQELFQACFDAAGYIPARTELRRLMAGVRVTVYVDNADLTTEQLLEVMDAAPDATFVFASSGRSLWSDGTTFRLAGLQEDAARALLERELGRPVPAAQRAAASTLWAAASGLPLPLLRAAALAGLTPDGDGTLPRPGEVSELLPLLLDRLAGDRAAMGVLHLLVTLDEAELAPAHIGALTGLGEPEAVCEHLVALGVLIAGEHGYRCAADVRLPLRPRFPTAFPLERLCAYLTEWAGRPATTPEEVAAHGAALDVVAALAEQAGRPDLAVRLTRAASSAMARSLRFGAWGRLLGRGWLAARAAGDRRAEAFFTHEEGVRALLIGKHVVSAALLAEAAWLARELTKEDGAAAGPVPEAGGQGDGAIGQAPEGGVPHPYMQDAGTAAPDAATGPVPGGDHPADGVSPVAPEGAGQDPSAGAATGPADGPGGTYSAEATRDTQLFPQPSGEGGAATGPDYGGGATLGPPPGDFDTAGHMAQNLPSPPAVPQQVPLHDPVSGAGSGHLAGGADGGGGWAAGFGDGGIGQAAAGAAGQGAGTAGAHAGTTAAGTVGAHAGAAAATPGSLGVGGSLTSLIVGGALALALGGAIVAITLSDSDSDGGGSEPVPTGFAGTWNDEWGNTFTVAESGGDAYRLTGPDFGCGQVSVDVTGEDGSFRGEQPWNDLSTCEHLGMGEVTFELAADGQSVDVHQVAPEGQPPCEINCDYTLTRQQR
ncbi:AAA family ATPase [Streptomyces marincola]|uniref:AAA family ATPase n=1 Tax=Streptomyces marincola TaxID=2878388 RepID=UPI001CF0E18B|nr:AAA family ATPase [Streptomyces marincola]UCM91263.1 ATP-binding protein [Streptomyces marincola]